MRLTVTLSDELDRTRRTRRLIEELIADPAQLGPDFQPVRRLADDAVVAWKATGRGRAGTDVGDTLALLAGAQSLGLVERLDWAFRCHALDAAAGAGVTEVHLTPEPETFGSPCPPRLAVAFGRGRRAVRVAAELYDDAFGDLPRLRGAVEEFRGWGWQIALADVADAPEAVAALPWLRPDLVQVDLSVPGRAAAPTVRRLLAEAAGLGAQIMAVGVDSPRGRDAAVELGATLGRGRLLGEPGPLPPR